VIRLSAHHKSGRLALAQALTTSMLVVGCATGPSNFEDQTVVDPHAGYVLFRPHWDNNGDTKADLQIKFVRYPFDGPREEFVYSMSAGASQVVTLAPGYYTLAYASTGRNGVAPSTNMNFVVKNGQVSYPGDWWFHQASAGTVDVLAPRKQNFHQHRMVFLHSEVERDSDAEQSYRRQYPRLSQVLPLVYTGP